MKVSTYEHNLPNKLNKGFTLIEMLVSVAVFSIVMLIAVGALLAMVDANKKAQALNSVMNNLNLAVESMSRDIRVGSTYHCNSSMANPPPVPGNIENPSDCSGGGLLLGFESSRGDSSDPNDQVVYRLNGTQIERSKQSGGGGTFVALTAPEVQIENFRFYVDGTSLSDSRQPRVIITIQGTAGVSDKIKSEFNIETMASQRVLDL